MPPIRNVSEFWPIYDSVIVSKWLYGSEAQTPGWYGSHTAQPNLKPMELFSSKERHSFFKERTEGNSDRAYCNLQSAETMDFAYRLYSVGVRFWGPITGFEGGTCGSPDFPSTQEVSFINSYLSHFWKADMPHHVGFDFRVEQDYIIENNAYCVPPGHGYTGAGASWSDPVSPQQPTLPLDTGDPDQLVQRPQLISVVNQGVPVIGNRYNFKNPIEIPRGALIEARIILSPYIQYVLADVLGPLSYIFQIRCPRVHCLTDGPPATYTELYPTMFGTRYGITVSLVGERLVQQRGQYHAPGAVFAAEE
jgi:hypothetical protein